MANDSKLVNLADLKEAFDDVKESIPSKTSQLTNDSGYTANTGTVTSVATGVGLTGGEITGSGTLKAKLRSETALTIASEAASTKSGRVYPVAVDNAGYLAVNVPWTDNNTTYLAGTGLSLSGTTFSNSGATGVKGNAESSYRTGNVSLTPANIGAVNKAGDTMTGDLTVQHSGDTFVRVKNTDTGALVYLDSASNGKHGLWSDGYWNGSAPVSNGKFIISRNTDGKVTVADHYDKDEVDAKFTTTSVFNLFTFDSTKCDLRFAKRTGNIVQLSVYVKTGVSNGNALITKIDNSILPTQLDYVAPLHANDGKLVTSGSVWIEANNLSKISYYGSITTVGGTATITYIIG